MAICAAAVEIAHRVQQRGRGGMAAGNVAGIAHARHAHLEQLRIICAVRLMTVGAVFHDRRVLPEEGAATLGVAAQAVFIGGGLDELLGIWRAVRIMATCAGHLAFAIRHVRGTLQLRPPHLMTLQAKLRLFQLCATHVCERLAEARVYASPHPLKGVRFSRKRAQVRIDIGRGHASVPWCFAHEG